MLMFLDAFKMLNLMETRVCEGMELLTTIKHRKGERKKHDVFP